MKSTPDFEIENSIGQIPAFAGMTDILIAGVDEAGRGPLCGPVVAAAVVFPRHINEIPLITDSKQMTAAKRAVAYDWIMQNCLVGLGQCGPVEIDELNILHASMLAMKRAIAALPGAPDFVLVDGNRLPINVIGRAIVKGDSKSISIAAASIVAKETRDKIMRELGATCPEYCWNKNAGYPTAAHLRAIKEFGINQHYRKSFAPVKKIIMDNSKG